MGYILYKISSLLIVRAIKLLLVLSCPVPESQFGLQGPTEQNVALFIAVIKQTRF
jgi:hypothetical protein